MRWKPSLWASVVPRNPLMRKPNHYGEMLRAAWENRDQLPFAWRVLQHGVCDGCALGTSGLRDWTIAGIHLCMVRLEIMRLNTAPAMDPARVADADRLFRPLPVSLVDPLQGGRGQNRASVGALPDDATGRASSTGDPRLHTLSWPYSPLWHRTPARASGRICAVA